MERNKIEKKYQWKLEDLYSSIEDYESDIKKLNDLVVTFIECKGKYSFFIYAVN